MAAVKTKSKTSPKSKQLKAGKKKPLNKWLIVGGVAAVAVIGVAVVRFSGASSYTFVNRTDKMSGGRVITSSGVKYRQLEGRKDQRAQSFFSGAQMKSTNTVCSHFKMLNDGIPKRIGNYSAVFLSIYDTKGRQIDTTDRISASTPAKTGQTGNVCLPVWGSSQKKALANGGVIVVGSWTSSTDESWATIGVDSIYGKTTKIEY